jgi:flagellar hook-length control protein FliK
MLPPALLAAAPQAHAAAPGGAIAQSDPASATSPTRASRDNGTDFVGDLVLALAGSASLPAPPPPAREPSPSNSAAPVTKPDSGPAPASSSPPTTPTNPTGNAQSGPATAKSANSDSPANPAGPAAAGEPPSQVVAVPSQTSSAPNATLPTVPAPAGPVVPKPPIATVPTKILNPGQPRTIPTVGLRATPTAQAPAAPAVPVPDPGGPTPAVGPLALANEKPGTLPTSPQASVPQALAPGDGGSGSASIVQALVTPAAALTAPRANAVTVRPVVSGGNSPMLANASVMTAAAAFTETAGSAPSVAEQIGHAIHARLATAPDDGRIDFHMSLEPPELGQVRVQLTLSSQTLTARLVAQDASTRQLIQSQMDSLRQRLQQTGLGLGQIDVSGGGGNSRGGQRQQPLLPFPDLSGPTAAPRPVAAPRPAAAGLVGGIDVLA